MTPTEKRTLRHRTDTLANILDNIRNTGATAGIPELADTILLKALTDLTDEDTANNLFPAIYAYACIISALDNLDN